MSAVEVVDTPANELTKPINSSPGVPSLPTSRAPHDARVPDAGGDPSATERGHADVDIRSHLAASVAPISPDTDQWCSDTHRKLVGSGDPSATERGHTAPDTQTTAAASVAPLSPDTDQWLLDTHRKLVGSGDPSATERGQSRCDTQCRAAASVAPISPDTDHRTTDTQTSYVGSGDPSSDQEPTGQPTPNHKPVPDPTPYVELRLFAEVFNDLQHNRIGLTNKISAAERTGYILVDPLAPLADAAKANEHQAALAMRRCLRRVAPELHDWAKTQPGVGEHLLARLLGSTGHPLWAYPHHWEGEGAKRQLVADTPYQRKVSQLWSYCGHGDATRKRSKGMTWEDGAALGNPRAKMVTRLIAEAIVKATVRRLPDAPVAFDPDTRKAIGDYGQLYLDARREYATRDGWTPGHQQSAALRLLGKHFLRDLWVAAHNNNEQGEQT